MVTSSRVGPLGAFAHTPVASFGCIQHHGGGSSSSWGQTDRQTMAKLSSRAPQSLEVQKSSWICRGLSWQG